MREVGSIIAVVLSNPDSDKARDEARDRVAALCRKYPLYEEA